MVHWKRVKKLWTALVIGLLVGAAGASFYLWKTKQKSPLVFPTNTQLSTSGVSTKSLTWTDPAGFTFQYPDGLTVDKHEEDQDNYAHVEFTAKDQRGNTIVWAKDLPRGVSDLASWIKSDKRFAEASVFDTILGGQPAKKILLDTPQRELIVGTVFDDVLWSVEATLDEAGFWSEVHQMIVDGFIFTPVQQDVSAGSETLITGEEPVDEEEVLE